ncbi:hypothetical protein [Deefgea sp. CFH1-16]|uniref:hypothetical protein n=1 Tax=Deefgea sp. CFH1-16 TaxID=2675457 RepID=UPI0015F5E516|nr:hypothetical protein [Deefgea sp. CFH1-16]MBM5574730.1 hypothetical protein [Deefgea sp. CFH1-16]
MNAIRVLGQITIPESLKQNLGEIRQTRSSAFAAKGVIEVHYYPQGNPNLPTGDAWQLDAEKTAFGIALLNRLGLAPEYMHDANLMGYAQLDPHTDIGFFGAKRARRVFACGTARRGRAANDWRE